MAAGRVDVTRRGDFHYYRKNSFCDRNGFHDLVYGQDHAQSRKIRYGVGSCSRLVGVGGDRCRKINGGSGGCKVDDLSGQGRCKSVLVNMSVVGDNEILQFEDGGGSIPTAKRRKFSPVVWDRVDKEVRISSRSRIVKKSTLLCSSPTLVHGELHNVIVDDVSTHVLQTDQHQEKHMSPAESHVATGLVGNFGAKGFDCSINLLPPEQCNKSIADLDEEKGVEHAEVQCISMSRWATKEDSPQQLCLRNNKRISPRTMVGVNTPEIGEFLVGSNQESGSDCLDYEVDSCDFLEIDESETQSEDGEGTSMLGKPADPKPRCMNMLHGCRSVFEFEKLGRICEGTYGIVYKARDKESGELVALKKVKMGRENEGFPLTALREINLLLALNHPSIVNVKEVVMDGDKNVFMVMEYMEYDLRRLIEVLKQPFTEIEVKCLMRQLLEGLRCLHDNWILHRDLKTSNLLISNTGKLKLCDFGMSRQYGSPLKPYTSLVVTLWYRAPELLLGAKQYSTAVDMWSVGCIMAELIAKQPLFDGANEVRQLDKIFTTLGLPTEVTWPGFADLPGAKASFIEQSKNTLRDKFPALSFKGSPILSEQGFDLLSKLLTYDPDKRITAKAALEHSWFHVDSEQERLWTQESLAKKIKALSYYGHSF